MQHLVLEQRTARHWHHALTVGKCGKRKVHAVSKLAYIYHYTKCLQNTSYRSHFYLYLTVSDNFYRISLSLKHSESSN
jgi:hypothetical protein